MANDSQGSNRIIELGKGIKESLDARLRIDFIMHTADVSVAGSNEAIMLARADPILQHFGVGRKDMPPGSLYSG